MNQLLGQLSQFINTVMELYPLPYQLVTDLHTLNAYLKSYTQSQYTLLERFVNRQVEKLHRKINNYQQKQNVNTLNVHLYEPMSSCQLGLTHKFSDMKLQIPTDMSERSISDNTSCFDRNQSAMLSQRSGRSSNNDGIKNDRHKFGNRQRNKTQKTLAQISNKENVHSNVNLKIEDLYHNDKKLEEKSLKFIKSEAELLHHTNHTSTSHRNSSTEARKDQASKHKMRYQSYENRGISHPSTLKIKLKSKTTLDLTKLKGGIVQLCKDLDATSNQLDQIWNNLSEDSEQKELIQE